MSSADSERLDDAELIWRRINKLHDLGDGKISSAAFDDPEMSVDRRQVVESMGHGVEFTKQDGVAVAELSVATVNEIASECNTDLSAVAKELPDNAAHALVLGKKTGGVRKRLRDRSTYLR